MQCIPTNEYAGSLPRRRDWSLAPSLVDELKLALWPEAWLPLLTSCNRKANDYMVLSKPNKIVRYNYEARMYSFPSLTEIVYQKEKNIKFTLLEVQLSASYISERGFGEGIQFHRPLIHEPVNHADIRIMSRHINFKVEQNRGQINLFPGVLCGLGANRDSQFLGLRI